MASAHSSELLGVGESEEEEYMKQFLIKPMEELDTKDGPVLRVIVPQPGFCVKLKSSEGKKVFINICQADNIPAPRPITDEELLSLLDSDDPSGFRIPMSLGEAHQEKDNSGAECTAYDVVISPEFLKTVQERKSMKSFFITVTMEGLEDKYNISLDRKWSILKNRKFLGFIPEQNIRTRSKPLIMDLGDYKTSPSSKNNSNGGVAKADKTSTKKQKEEEDERNKKITEPMYEIIKEPAEGHPEYIVAEIQLPLIKAAASFTLDIGEDRLLLETRSKVYRLDIYLPYSLVQEETVAQFNRKTRILTVTMPVQPQDQQQLQKKT